MVKLFGWLSRQRSNEARDEEESKAQAAAEAQPSETKKLWATVKTGITGETEADRARIAQAKEDAKQLRKEMKAKRHEERISQKVAAIKEAPLHDTERQAALRQKATSTLKSVYTGLSGWGAANAPLQPSQPARPAKGNRQQPQQSYDPFGAFNMGGMGGGGFGAGMGDMWGNQPRVKAKKGKQRKQYDPWQLLK